MHACEWRPVLGAEDFYEVSCCGQIRRIGTLGLVNRHLNPGGYFQVSLKRAGRRESVPVHRVVAEAFLGSRPKGLVVDHKNRRKTDNRVFNLRYCTHRQNHENCILHDRKLAKAKAEVNPATPQERAEYQKRITSFAIKRACAEVDLPDLSAIAERFKVSEDEVRAVVFGK